MKVKVLQWDETNDCCLCESLDKKDWLRLDLVVSGDLGETHPKELIGKVVEFERTHPWISIAHGVKIVNEVEA